MRTGLTPCPGPGEPVTACIAGSLTLPGKLCYHCNQHKQAKTPRDRKRAKHRDTVTQERHDA